MPRQMEATALGCYVNILRRISEFPKTTEGQAEAFARHHAFYDLHRDCPIVWKNPVKPLSLEKWAKKQGLDEKDFKKAVKEAKKVLTKQGKDEGSEQRYATQLQPRACSCCVGYHDSQGRTF